MEWTLDFLDTDNCILLPGKLNKIPKAASWKDIVVEESQWFNINEDSAYKALKYSFDNSVLNSGVPIRFLNLPSFVLNVFNILFSTSFGVPINIFVLESYE